MALNEVKNQVLLMLQSILTLDSSEQMEAVGFLQDCIRNFGLSLSKDTFHTGGLVDSDKRTSKQEETNIKTSILTYEHLESKDYVKDSHKCQTFSVDFSESAQSETNSDEKTQKLEDEKNLTIMDDPIKHLCKNSSNTKISVTTEDNKTENNDENENESITCTNSLDDFHLGKRRTNDCKETAEGNKQKKDCDLYKCPSCLGVFENKSSILTHFKSYADAPMTCKNCRNSFPNILNFWDHQKNGKCKIHHLKCHECNEKFKHQRHYLKHILGHKDNNCRYCDDKFSTWTQYKTHLKEKHPTIKMERDLIPCKFCPLSFHRHIGLYNHYRVKHSKGKFVCLSCGLLLPTKEKHKEHVLVHESEKNWKCKICKMKFYRRQQLLLHVSIHKLGIYKCLTCDITVTSKTDLQKHKKNGHDVKGLERRFECEICHKTFSKRFTLANHLATHSKDKCYTCKYCVKSFSTLDSLNRHQKRKSHFEKAKVIIPESKYEKVYEDKLICEKCGKQYKTQRELKCHLIVHKSVYDCNECGKTFTLKFNLTKHLRLHQKAVRVVCELCGDTFNQLSALNEHCLMKHSDIRKAKCEICGKAFKRKSELNRHMRIHEYKRPFACFCGKAYKQSAHLKNHYKSAHASNKERPLVETPVDFQNNETSEIFRDGMMEKRKKEYIGGEHGPLVPLDNIESEAVFRSSNSFIGMQINENSDSKVNYVPSYGMRYQQSDMEPINVNYDDLNFSSQTDKRGLVFTSPAVNLSMVAIPEVVQNGIEIGDGHRDVEESVEPFNKIPDDSSQIQLLNLSEHIVQEYLLNLQ